MSENTGFAVNLIEDPTFTAKVPVKIPGDGVDAWRNIEFTAKFRVMSETEQEDLPVGITTRDFLRRVLLAVDGIPGATTKAGEELSPVDVVIHNTFTSDAAFTLYKLRTTQNGRDLNSTEAMKSATTRGNSSRSRVR